MQIVKDKINQALNRITYSRNEWQFCISILKEKNICDSQEEDNDFSSCFYRENQYTLDNLYFIILRMLIIDLYTLIHEDEKNSIQTIINSIRILSKRNSGIEKYDDLIEYVKRFETEMEEYKDVINRIKIIRTIYVAHTDGEIKRLRYKDVEINVNELEKLIKKIFAFLFNVGDLINNRVTDTVLYFMEVEHIGNGSNNNFEKMRKFYKKGKS